MNNSVATTSNGYMDTRKPRESIVVNGVEFHLRRDASDPSQIFPYERVNWINAVSAPIEGQPNTFMNIVYGLIPSRPNTLERPVSTVFVSFSRNQRQLHPSLIKPEEIQCFHVYCTDGLPFAQAFMNEFLKPAPITKVDDGNGFSPFPHEITPSVAPNAADSTVSNVVSKEGDK